jgi:hypothetical protein
MTLPNFVCPLFFRLPWFQAYFVSPHFMRFNPGGIDKYATFAQVKTPNLTDLHKISSHFF